MTTCFFLFVFPKTVLAADGFNTVGIRATLNGMQLNVDWDGVPSSVTSGVTGLGQIVRPFEGYNVGIEVRSGWFSPPVVLEGCGVSPGYNKSCGNSMTIDLSELFMQGKFMQGFVVSVYLSAMYGLKDVGLDEYFSGNFFHQFASPPVTLTAGKGDGQRGQTFETLNPFVVKLQRDGLPLRPENDYNFKSSLIIWRIISKPIGAFGGVLSSWESVFYDGAGQASITYSLGDREGKYQIKGFCGICNNGAGDEVIFTVHAENTLKLKKVTEDRLTGAAGEAITQPLAVQVTDAQEKGREGIDITYRIVSQPQGAVAATTESVRKKTNADGTSSATLTLGDKVGDYVVEVRCAKCTEGSPVTFTATVVGPEGCTGNGASIASQVNFASGNLFYTKNLLSLSGVGPQVGFTLAFNSLDVVDGPLGVHWTHSYAMAITRDSGGFITLKEEGGKRVAFEDSGAGMFVPIAHFGRPGHTLEKQNDGYVLRRRDGSRYAFNAAGQLTEIIDRNNNALSLSYASAQLTTLTDTAGRETALTYDAAGRLIRLTDPAGRTNVLDYDAAGRLSQITEANGEITAFLYDADGQMIQRTEPDGSQIHLAYDGEGRLISATDASGIPITVSYQPEINQATLTDRDGGVTTYVYDLDLDQPLQITAPDGGITTNTYDAQGNLITATDAQGGVTQYVYDAQGNMTAVTDPSGNVTQYTYDAVFNQVTSITDPQGAITTNTYDAQGNLISTTDPTGGTTQYEYDAQGRLINLTDPQGRTSTFVYDDAGNLVQSTDPAGATTRMRYDAVGNLISRTDDSGQTTVFKYDANNRLIEVTDPLGHVTSFAYDAKGNRTAQTDAKGNTTQYRYNHLDKLTQVTDPAGGVTRYTYDAKGNLTSIADANGNKTTYVYDVQDRLVSETDPLGNTIGYVYDMRDNLISKTDAEGQTITYTYDVQNRLTEKTYPDNSTETYSYDVSGRMLTATNPEIGYTFVYDAGRRTTSVSDTRGNTLQVEYNAAGQRSKLIYPDGKEVTYTYDIAGRLSALTDWQGGATDFTYDALGRRSSLTRPNGTQSQFAYDAAGRLIDLRHLSHTGKIIDEYRYTHDAVGNRLTDARPDVKQSYHYDLLDRLTEAMPTKRQGKDKTQAHKAEAFAYDAVGNRLIGPDAQDLYTYNNGNQLTSDSKHDYAYDRNGNLIRKTAYGDEGGITVWTYAYDFEHRLIEAIKQEANEIKTVRFKYDPLGRRIEKRIKAFEAGGTQIKTVTYIYDNEDIIVEKHNKADGGKIKTEVTRYLHGPGTDEPLMIEREKGRYYYHADGLGSITALTDAREKVVERYTYSSFGEIKRQGNKVKNHYTYTGREWDEETGLYFYRARYYDAEAGRFTSFDPILRARKSSSTKLSSCNSTSDSSTIESFLEQPLKLNPFVYVENNPANNTDPSGLFSVKGNCCGKEEEIRSATQNACNGLSAAIPDKALRTCIERRCRNAAIKCQNRCDPGVLGYNFGIFGIRFHTAHICVNTASPSLFGPIAIHEWAHSCGWNHGDGKGVPGDSGFLR